MPINHIRVFHGRCAVRALQVMFVVAICSFTAGCGGGKPERSPVVESEPVVDDAAKRDHDRSPGPLVSREKQLVLNIGFPEQNEKSDDPLEAVLFCAGEEMPISEASVILNREWRLYQDLGANSNEITVVLRCDAAVTVKDQLTLVEESLKAGFQNVSLKKPNLDK